MNRKSQLEAKKWKLGNGNNKITGSVLDFNDMKLVAIFGLLINRQNKLKLGKKEINAFKQSLFLKLKLASGKTYKYLNFKTEKINFIFKNLRF